MMPKMSVRPDASKKSIIPNWIPFKIWAIISAGGMVGLLDFGYELIVPEIPRRM